MSMQGNANLSNAISSFLQMQMMQPNTQSSALPSQQQMNILGENLHMPQMSNNGMYQQ